MTDMKEENILQMIAGSARLGYNNIAIETQSCTWTYGMLLSAAETVAEYVDKNMLQSKFVLVEARRCPEFIVAILGVMLAKRAFVPVDLDWPKTRIDVLREKLEEHEVVLEMSQIREITVQSALANKISEFEKRATSRLRTPHDPAYCICTSGSTGKPKCVEVLHRSIPNLVENQRRVFESDRSSCFLWMLSPVFDGSLSDIFVALASGSRIAIDSGADMLACAWKTAEGAEATHIDIPPALLAVLPPEEMPKNVRCLIVGGQQLGKNVVEQYAPRCRVVNVYGPTEATICTSAKVYDRTNSDASRISIGLPFQGVEYKIDAGGELLIGGVQLASGYVGDSELTSEKFVTDAAGERWYKTGDRVDFQGEYFFVGRADRQFKVNGKLVAPEEIEAAALKHGMVAAVVEHLGKVKCVVEDPGLKMAAESWLVKKMFNDELPEWMVPSVIKFAEKLPRLQTGKIDYASVTRMLDRDQTKCTDRARQSDTGPESVLGKVKKMMVCILRRSQFDSIPSSASFRNDCGADSIQQIMLSIKIKHEWGVQLTAADFKLDDTPAGIAAAVEQKIDGKDSMPAARLQAKVDELAKSIVTSNIDLDKSTVVVTGAGGFLGSHVLSMILGEWSRIVCVVRAEDDVDARKKVLASLVDKAGTAIDPAELRKIECYAGDLSEDRFGLADPLVYDRLCRTTRLMYHIAGEVNDWKNAEDLAASNIEATKNVIRFCKRARSKLVFASTLSVFVSRSDLPRDYVCREVPLKEDGIVVGGYAQSKWIAEKLVSDTMHDDARIMRYGLLTEPTSREMTFSRSTLSMFLRGLMKIHVAPEVQTELKVDFTPVDIAAAVTVRAFASVHPIMHVHAGMQVKFSDIAAKALPGVPLLDYQSWKVYAARKLEESGYDKDIAACIEALAREEGSKFGPFDLFQSTGMTFSRDRALEAYDKTLKNLEENARRDYVDKLLRTSYDEAHKRW